MSKRVESIIEIFTSMKIPGTDDPTVKKKLKKTKKKPATKHLQKQWHSSHSSKNPEREHYEYSAQGQHPPYAKQGYRTTRKQVW